jgi:lipoate-protein ligase A
VSVIVSPDPRALAPRWRLFHTPPLSGVQNMALDVALMARARRTGEAVFRIYEWERPTLSFGRNQTALGRYRLDQIAARQMDVVRRPTGGRAILHHREVTYSVTAPSSETMSLAHSYHAINRLLLAGLAQLGVRAVSAQPATRAARPSDMPCFATPSAGEMVTDAGKLVGSAQWRDAGALLQHGSILVDDDQRTLAELMHVPPATLPPPGTLHAALGRAPSAAEVAEAMFAAVRTHADPGAEPLTLTAVERDDSPPLDFFAADEWTWRR